MRLSDSVLQLASYVESVDGLLDRAEPRRTYGHMGAVISDSVLQAGLNYRTVVEPRVRRLLHQHPEACTTTGFRETIAFHGLSTLLNWRHPEKPRRIMDLTWFFSNEEVETEDMLRSWLGHPGNARLLLGLPALGPKTVDYMKMLVGIATVPVDRHVRLLVSAAGLTYSRYEDIQQVVELTADHLGLDASSFDRAIWAHMSTEAP